VVATSLSARLLEAVSDDFAGVVIAEF
jgi:hypothetical protein